MSTIETILSKMIILGNNIFGNLLKGTLKRLKRKSMSYYDFLNSLFAGIQEENRCIYSNILFVSLIDDLEDEEDKVVPPETFVDELGELSVTLKDFIDNIVPTISINKETVSEINIEQFDEMTKRMEKLEKEILLKDEAIKEERRKFEYERMRDNARNEQMIMELQKQMAELQANSVSNSGKISFSSTKFENINTQRV